MKPPDSSTRSPSLTFAGAAVLLLILATFCAFPCGAYVPAIGLAALGLISLSLSRPRPEVIPLRAHGPRFPRRSAR